MKYSRPEALLIGSSLAVVANTAATKGGVYLETPDLPMQNYINSQPPPAYEADE